ncbi:MAG TPA: PAS domain S-box protein [Verrucomicrobiae bacterium]|nr:PAS domain S-box protein [Verrucomicrobiae bacterium]
MNSSETSSTWDERTNAMEQLLKQSSGVFQSLFERSADPIWLFDPQTITLLDCNEAAVRLIGAENKQQLLRTRPEQISPPFQPDGSTSANKSAEIVALVEKEKAHRFEWVIRRLDNGLDIPVEVSSTAMPIDGRSIHVVISRDISERKKAERELLELTQVLERRVSERMAAFSTSEARFRALVEHAPEAIVVFDGDTGRFLFGNEHACRLYGVPMKKLAELTPVDVSAPFQPCGQRSSDLARQKMDEALAGGMPVFEWLHRQQPNGRLIPTEVRLLRLPAEGQNLIRASIIDNTERKAAERALRESEAKFRALFEGSSQGVVLHDENEILDANPAAARIMRRQSPADLLGRHPEDLAPPFQPDGQPSAVIARIHIEDCMTRGSARFEWVGSTPDGKEIPLEVALTRIEWSGRQLIQAFITDITERKEAERALRETNRELHREIEQRTRAEESLKERVRMSTLAAEVAVALNAAIEPQPMLQRCSLLMVQHLDVAFVRIWTLNTATQTLELQASAGCYTHLDGAHSRIQVGQYKIGFIAREKKPLLTNSVQGDPRVSDREWAVREGMVAFAGYPLLIEDRLLGVLGLFARRALPDDVLTVLGSVADSIALGIERKRAQNALAESEARFGAAFQASPAFLGILSLSDGRYVLANDAHLHWLGADREEVLGRTCVELGMWENPAERDVVLKDMQSFGSIRQRECRWRNRRGERFTILLSAETIQLNKTPHMLSMALDITQRKRAEEELLKTLEREKELSQLKSNFVSMVSHEFRTPLGIIHSSGELLRDFHVKMRPAERDEQLESIIRNTGRMAGMMEEVLVLSRLDAGKLDFQPALLDLNVFCRRVVDEVLSATNRRCVIEISLSSVSTEANADERLLGYIFTNLLSNAVKYSEPGATIHFTVEQVGNDAVCVVCDKGIGISETDQQQLFKAFHRGSNVGNRPGTGLGLLLVKRCADLHRGQVQVKSKVGEGTTVIVKLPLFETNP